MNKKKIIYVTLIIITIVTILGVGHHINASNDNDILTKKSAFDIIDNIEEIVIACLSKDGNKHLSLKNKYDITSMYIVKNNIEDVIEESKEEIALKIDNSKREIRNKIDSSKQSFKKK